MQPEFDMIFLGGTVVDGSGAPAMRADVAVKDGIVAAVGDLSSAAAAEGIDITGLHLCPGFIDSHCHTDTAYSVTYPGARGKVMQGVTTDVCGLCGGSAAPFGEAHIEEYRERHHNSKISPITVKNYLEEVDSRGNSTNIAMFVGNANLRLAAVGYENRHASPQEMGLMKEMLRQAMQQGAFGLSSGLTYIPSAHADTSELIELCRVIAPFGGIYNSHMRNEGDRLIESVAEVIEITEKSGCRGHISHLKASGRKNHGKVFQCLSMIEAANARGVEVTYDVYPYTAGSISLISALPPWVQSEGYGQDFINFNKPDFYRRIKSDMGKNDWENIALLSGYDNIVIGFAAGLLEYEGKSLSEIASEHGCSPLDALIKVLIDTRAGATIVYQTASEEDLITLFKGRRCVLGTDAFARDYDGQTAAGKPHPRNYGSFPRLFRNYVLDSGILTLEDAVHLCTGRAASTFGLKGRGVIRAGMTADITVMDLANIRETGDYRNPVCKPEGIVHVLMGGRFAVRAGCFCDIRAGRAIRAR